MARLVIYFLACLVSLTVVVDSRQSLQFRPPAPVVKTLHETCVNEGYRGECTKDNRLSNGYYVKCGKVMCASMFRRNDKITSFYMNGHAPNGLECGKLRYRTITKSTTNFYTCKIRDVEASPVFESLRIDRTEVCFEGKCRQLKPGRRVPRQPDNSQFPQHYPCDLHKAHPLRH